MGSVIGPPLAKALIKKLGATGVAIQGVDYTASIASNALMGSAGGPVMASLAKKALAQCPNVRVSHGKNRLWLHYLLTTILRCRPRSHSVDTLRVVALPTML